MRGSESVKIEKQTEHKENIICLDLALMNLPKKTVTVSLCSDLLTDHLCNAVCVYKSILFSKYDHYFSI